MGIALRVVKRVRPDDRRASTAAASVCTDRDVGYELITEADAGEWNTYVNAHPEASGYHDWRWRRVFERGLGHRCHYLAATFNGAICGVLPLVEVKSRLFGSALSSLPYVNYGGILADDASIAAGLLDQAGRIGDQRTASYVLLRHKTRMFPRRPARDHKVTLLLKLPSTRDAMWRQLDRKVRNQIRKAEKSGVTVESGDASLLDAFYPVFARNMRDLGTPVYGRELFAAILDEFPEKARLHVGRINGRPVAGALSYEFHDSIEVPSASSLRECRSSCPNYLVYWSVISHAIERGLAVFDFGRSTPDDGTYLFKAQWGATPVQLWWEYRLRAGTSMPADDRHSAKYQAVIAAWQRLPVAVATAIGPRIARLVP